MSTLVSRNESFGVGMGNIRTTTLVDQEGSPKLLQMSKHDEAGNKLAYLEYEHDPEVDNNYITWMHSTHPGQGHMTELVHNLYRQHPKHSVNWGSVIHPGAAKLFNKFYKLHPNRTDGEINIDEDYSKAMAEEN